MTKKEKYEYRKANGICIACGNPNDRIGKTRCSTCSNYQKERREMWLMLGICPRCKKNRLFGDYSTCFECADNKNEKYSQYSVEKKRMLNKQRNSRYKEKRMINRLNGKCQCGRNIPVDSKYLLCPICRKRGREGYYKYNTNHISKEDRYSDTNICTRCLKEERYGKYKVCKNCYDKLVLASRSRKVV